MTADAPPAGARDGSSGPLGVAVVGCGTISDQYLSHLTTFPDLDVRFCSDLDPARARDQAAAHGVAASGTLAQALEDPGVELVVNLTPPAAHAAVAEAAIAAGRHVFNEKPLTSDVAGGRALLAAAARAGVRVGCAPDTVLGAGLQTARRLIEQGAIGRPLTAVAMMQGPGPDVWHPSPEFLFQAGAGPLFDLGPYYLTVLATIFGPAQRTAAVGRRAAATRTIATGPRAGTEFAVQVPTHLGALVEYRDGAAASLLFSFDSPLPRPGFFEITGSEATIALPDPNHFDGDVRIYDRGAGEWRTVPARGPTDGRGLGVLELARSLRAQRPHRTPGELGAHVVELICAVHDSADGHAFVSVASEFTPPALLPEDWDPLARTL